MHNGTAVTATWERRLQAEWRMLQELARRNPTRITDLRAEDAVFHLTLRQTPAISLTDAAVETVHALRIIYPRFFPMVPMELYLERPVRHANIHPQTGFVCLWDRHRVSNNVEHAVLKTAAMLGWRLWNREALHGMQPECLPQMETASDAIKRSLDAPPLFGMEHALPVSTEYLVGKFSARKSRLT